MKKEFDTEENGYDLNGDGVMDEQELLAASIAMDEEEKEEKKHGFRKEK